jgi:hypothetical protein
MWKQLQCQLVWHRTATGLPSSARVSTLYRAVFQEAAEVRLVNRSENLCGMFEAFEGQNLGHEGVLTTFYSYGTVATTWQGEIIQGMTEGARALPAHATTAATFEKLLRQMQNPNVLQALSAAGINDG